MKRRTRRQQRSVRIPLAVRMSHYCHPCDKKAWETREGAKRAARDTPTGGAALHAYRCPADGVTWHIGHMGSDKTRDFYRERTQR